MTRDWYLLFFFSLFFIASIVIEDTVSEHGVTLFWRKFNAFSQDTVIFDYLSDTLEENVTFGFWAGAIAIKFRTVRSFEKGIGLRALKSSERIGRSVVVCIFLLVRS